MKVVCIMCGLRQLAWAGTNWKFLLSPRPIKLRVNLAPLIIAAGASPSKKNLANGEKYIKQLWQISLFWSLRQVRVPWKELLQQAICSTRRTGYYYIKRIITFLICAKEEQENPVKVIVERPKYRGGRACASCRPYPRDAYSVIQITTKTHEQPFSLQLCFALVLKWTPVHKKFARPVHLGGASCFWGAGNSE